jgi:hypothetical protein
MPKRYKTTARAMLGVCFLFCFYAASVCQTPLELADTNYHPLTNPTDIVLPIKCDHQGNVYFRSAAARGPGKFDVVEVAPDGSQKAIYTYASDANLKDATLLADSAAEHGEMYELVRARGRKLVLLRFSENGQIESDYDLEVSEPFVPSHLEVLPRGTIFVSGTLIGEKAGAHAGEPVNILYDNGGHKIKDIHLKPESGALKQQLKEADRSGSQKRAVQFGRTTIGDDGDLYIMRAISPAVVYVVSPTGRTERRLTVPPPVKGSEPAGLLVHGGRVAIEFSLPDAPDVSGTRIRVVDSRSGHTISDYSVTNDLGEGMACYNGEEFTFLGSKDGWPSLMQASTR